MAAPKALPDKLLLQACLAYDPGTGSLSWRVRPAWTFQGGAIRDLDHVMNAWNSAWAGKPALASLAKNGYLKGAFQGQNFYAHRIIFMLVHGYDPKDIDHDDGNRTNNRISNLLDRSRTENMRNRALSSNNTSGHAGVNWSDHHKLWFATIGQSGQTIHLGWFSLQSDAIVARQQAEIELGYHPNHGRR